MAKMQSKRTKRQREMAKEVGRWEKSGLSMREFAERNGHNPATFMWWRRVLAQHDASDQGGFIELSPRSLAVGDSKFEVRLPSGIEVGVSGDFDADALSRLLGVLGRC